MPIQSLAGTRIAAFTQFLMGPAGVQYLADLGADVIKVEPPGAGAWERRWAGADTFPGGVSAFFLLAHRNVRSLTLDLKSELGLAAARRLIAASDVVVENFRPGVMERFGLGYERVRELRPDLIYVSASGYGAETSSRHLPGQDLLIQARSGLAWLAGREGRAPASGGAAIVDQHGAVLLAMAVLAAVLHRQRTGEGQRVEVVMMQAALDLATEPVVYHLNGSPIRQPRAWIADTFHDAPYGMYPTRDGWVAISMTTVAKVRSALGGGEELASYEDPALAFSRRDEISEALARHLRQLPTREVIERLQAQGVWCAAVNDLETALSSPEVAELDPILEFEHPRVGRVRVLKHPIRYGAGEPELRQVPPEVGEHTDQVLEELGYSPQEIQTMRESGAI
ncbi:MAG TPA: CaiB/BaiF CoA-transferase family protein [Candidatus Dormibacteraeota bacterium]|jgi:crotonobetainyl-CoA:carnitine CoA-transferase CaiB-like acyl-CoA transferase|nr:CaiB/BaiF CoA-transferase family protein [Candidatus Dormibacteraeota bacterium]